MACLPVQAGAPWVSVLVRTGVFSGPPGTNSASDPAHLVMEDCLEAVRAALVAHAPWTTRAMAA